MPVLDASAILNSFPFSFERGVEYLTVPSVLGEMKDLRSKAVVDSGLDSGKLRVFSPSDESVERVKSVSRNLGLSVADVEVLALALERRAVIWTDDHGIQKAARTLGVKFERVIHS